MKNYTIIPNELLDKYQLSIPEKYLLSVLLRFCGQDNYCYPSQKTLAKVLGYKSDRQIRTLINKLVKKNYIEKKRTGFNKPNTYTIHKEIFECFNGNSTSYPLKINKKTISSDLGTKTPLHKGIKLPTNNTYRKATDKTRINKGIENLREDMIRLGIKRR